MASCLDDRERRPSEIADLGCVAILDRLDATDLNQLSDPAALNHMVTTP